LQTTTTDEQRRAYEEYLSALTTGRKMYRISDLLQMKPSFQRTMSKQQVSNIVKDWQVHRFDDPVVCVCSDGTELLDDGQHRVEAAAQRFGQNAELLCRIAYTDLPGKEFVALNTGRRGVSAYWKHAANLSDGDETATALDAVVRRHGFFIGHGGGVRCVNAVNTITDLFRRDAESLDLTLGVLASVISKREDENGWLKGHVIQAVWYIIRNYDCDLKQLARGLAKTTPMQAAPKTQNDPSANAGDVIIAYNKQLPEHKRLNISRTKWRS
jgi:hypothetical protein